MLSNKAEIKETTNESESQAMTAAIRARIAAGKLDPSAMTASIRRAVISKNVRNA